jgi:parvulin-like peptidyl-prolyl isomerase
LHCEKKEDEEHLAIVGEDYITFTEMDKRIEILFDENQTIEKKIIEVILDDLIERKLITNKGKQLGLDVNTEELNKYLETMYGDKKPDDYQKQLAREDLIIAKVLQKEIASKIASSFVEETISNESDNSSEYVVFYEITTDTEETINEVYNKLNSGEDFDYICKEYSCTPSSSKGGRVGPVNLHTLPEEFRNNLENLSEDEFSSPYQTEYGHHILKLISRLSSEQYENSQYTIESMKQSFRDVYKNWIDEIYQESYVKINQKALNEYAKKFIK